MIASVSYIKLYMFLALYNNVRQLVGEKKSSILTDRSRSVGRDFVLLHVKCFFLLFLYLVAGSSMLDNT